MSLKELKKNSPIAEDHFVFFANGSDIPVVKQAALTPCVIHHFDLSQKSNTKTESFSAFDELVDSLENNPIESALLHEDRKWIAKQFYQDSVTLASLRLQLGLSQKQLGQACGIEQPHVSRYELGRHEPSLTTAATMAKALGVNIDLYLQAWNNTRHQAEIED